MAAKKKPKPTHLVHPGTRFGACGNFIAERSLNREAQDYNQVTCRYCRQSNYWKLAKEQNEEKLL